MTEREIAMQFDRYFTNQEIETTLKTWADSFPKLTRLMSIGKSFEGSPIWMLTITNLETGADIEKPALWIDGNIHATEIAAATTSLYIANSLLSGYGEDSRITRLLDTSTFYIIPRVNPDGAALAMAPTPCYLRSGVRPYPWEEKDEGLHPQDINGDRRILQMRIQDPTGDWKISSLDERLMEKRKPDEHGGVYYRLLTEGLIEDYDGYIIKEAQPREGLDFNRNFPFEWRPEGDQSGAGPYPTSEPEIKALVDFIAAHPNINVAITFHTFSGVVLRPYSTKADDEMETEDLWVYQKIGEIAKQSTGYACVSTFHDFKYHPKEVTSGAFDDWIYDQLGAYSFTIELWDLPTRAGIENRKLIEWFRSHPHEDDLKILQWVEKHAEKDAYISWYPFDHPQLGQVELGGFNRLYTWINPPPAYMGDEAARNLPFVLSLGDMLPCLTLHTLKLAQLGEDTYQVDLVVENSGFLPTYTSVQGKKRKAMRPVRAEIHLPAGAILANGKRRVEIGHLEGRSNKFEVSVYSTSPTDNRGRVEWVVKAPAGTEIGIKVTSERAGTIQRKVQLGVTT
jgi:murein tripeptide amidase MpaA